MRRKGVFRQLADILGGYKKRYIVQKGNKRGDYILTSLVIAMNGMYANFAVAKVCRNDGQSICDCRDNEDLFR
ncbi:MAG: hypothetical protein AseanaTS_14660 [Candidatus Pelagadaptatus aseana]